MSVTVDQKPLSAETLGLRTIGQVFKHVRKDNRLIVYVTIDGREPDRHRLKAIKRAPVHAHTVFIETADPRDIAFEALKSVEAELDEAERLKTEAAELLGRQQNAPAMEKLSGCFSIWQHAEESVRKTAQLLRLDLNLLCAEGRAMTELLADFTARLREIRALLEQRDFAALAQKLLHEMTAAAQRWRAGIHTMRITISPS